MKFLKTKPEQFQKKIKEAPLLPGCYLYKDINDEIIYVGKAKSIVKRVKSYFSGYEKLDEQKQTMIDLTADVEFLVVDTEFEALILETNLIKKYKPRFNILMRDGKNYIYVRFEKIRRKGDPIPNAYSVIQDFPRITVVREKKKDGAEYFGPYPDTAPVRRVLKKLRRIYPFRSGNELVYMKDDGEIYSSTPKPSLYYHIGLSKGTEAGLEKKEDYLKRFKSVKKFFEGKKQLLIADLERDLKNAVKELNFEKAAVLRDKINDIKYVTAYISVDNNVDDVVITDLKKKEHNNAIDNLIKELNFPTDKLINKKSFRIECYDISNIQGTNAVGSMVVMIDGVIQPKMYRRFKIKMKNEPNDFAMLQEVLTRRFKQYIFNNKDKEEITDELPDELVKRMRNWTKDESFSQKPDLIIIDGGKGQLASTYRILYQFGLHNDIPIVGLAKKQEEIFKLKDQFKDEYSNQINDSDMFKKIMLKRRSPSLFLVQRIRDEAHRFAITYHRNLRSKKMI